MRISRPELSAMAWRKSTYSNSQGGNCLEVADRVPGVVPVRDSKRPHAPALIFANATWTSFITQVKVNHTA